MRWGRNNNERRVAGGLSVNQRNSLAPILPLHITFNQIELDTKSCRDKVGHAIRDAANLIEARKQKQQKKKKGKTTGLEEESKYSSRGRSHSYDDDDDDDIFYEAFPEEKQEEEKEVDLDDDPFVQHINQVLGPLPRQEETRDPLRDFLDSLGRDDRFR